jgi:hypothetical protein
LSIARRVWVLLLMAGLAPATQAEDTPVTKPATAGTSPPHTPAKSAPAASPSAARTAKKEPAAQPPVPEADDELLEFLGSVDTLEQDSKEEKND